MRTYRPKTQRDPQVRLDRVRAFLLGRGYGLHHLPVSEKRLIQMARRCGYFGKHSQTQPQGGLAHHKQF